ncbi:MAG: rubrerythrin family protein [Candidatus Bathyarchaeia archaeon]
MPKTEENLKAAFAGESQANWRYTFFAERAERDGLKQVAKLFRAAAMAEGLHAKRHLIMLKGVKSTAENLQAAIEGESYESREMYPGFEKDAGAEGNKAAALSFEQTGKVEKVHEELFRAALKAVETDVKLEEKPYWVCGGCGNTVLGEPPERCPIYGASKSMFKRVD